MKSTPLINDLTSGEWSPLLEGRSDLEQYSRSAGGIENLLVLPYGGVTKIPGTYFVAEIKNSAKKARLIPFEFNAIQSYILEFGNQYIRFYMDHGQIFTTPSEAKLLLHCDGFDASTEFPDSGAIGHVVTAHGNAQIDTAEKVFGTGSALFDGDEDYLSIPDHASWDIVANNATNRSIDFWVRHGGGNSFYMSQIEDAQNYWSLSHNEGSGLRFLVSVGGTIIIDTGLGGIIPDMAWHHILFAKVGNKYAMYLDGIQVNYVEDDDVGNFTGPLYIGAHVPFYTKGHLEEIRLSEGNPFGAAPVAGLTDTITVPTVPYPLGGGGGDSILYELLVGDGVTYLEADLPYLHFVQEAGIMYIVHPSYSPKKLSRSDHEAWTLVDYVPQKGPLLPVNTDVASTIAPSADTGAGITLTAVNDIFNAGHVDNFVWRIKGGYVKIVGFTDTKHVTANVMYEGNLGTGPGATDDWAEAAWSVYRGYPGAVTLYEQRLCFAYSSHKPQTIWGSSSGNYELMIIGSEDADAIVFTLATSEVIRWIFGDILLFIGTTGGVFNISSGDVAYPLTPTNVVVRKHTNFGCNTIAPVKMGDFLYYVQRNNRTLREYVYEYTKRMFLAIDATLLAEHILKPKVVSIGYQQSPYNLLYCIRSDGEVSIFTRNLIQGALAWARLSDLGKIESVAVIPRKVGGDEVWFIFNRTVGGETKRFIEYLGQFSFESLADAFFVRSGLSYSGEPTSTMEGLDHLIGEEVAILGDGAVFPKKTVDAEGGASLSTACSKIHAGLSYPVKLRLQKLESGSVLGTAQGKIQRISQLAIKFYRSLGCSFGTEDKKDVLPFRSTGMDMDSPPDLFTGTKKVVFPKGYGKDIKVEIYQDQPLPLTILSMVPFVETYES